MKNIIIVGVSQSGLYELSSLVQENFAQEKGYQVLGGFLNVFGDRYSMDGESTHGKLSVANYEEGAYKRSFMLNEKSEITEFRDYGAPVMSTNSSSQELRYRIALLKSSKSPSIITLTTWELMQIRKESADLEREIQNLMSSSDTIAIDLENISEVAASYVLAHETGKWVTSMNEEQSHLPGKVIAKSSTLNQFKDEVKTLRSLLRGGPSLRTVTNLEVQKGSQATRKLFGINAPKAALFSKTKYRNDVTSYISNKQELMSLSKSLEA